MSQEAIGSMILSPVLVATGDPAGESLENFNTNVLANGSICYVEGGPGQGEWQLQKEAVDAPDGVTIVEPIAGPGRWFIKLFPGPGGGGGGGGITSISGTNGISITNPVGPATVVSGAGLIPVTTIQNIAAAGPTAVTNTMNTHARVNFAGAAAVTLPAGAVGKQVVVKDVSGAASTNPITVSGGTIDGGASYIISTDYGSATFICTSIGPDVWDVV